MKRELSEAYIDFYNKYQPLYKKTLDNFILSVYKLLIYEPEFSISSDSCDGSIISLISEEQESILKIDSIDVGLYYSLPYSIPGFGKGKGFYGTLRHIRLDNIIILASKFSKLAGMKEYLDLFCLFKDYQVDYIQLLLNNKIDTELDLIPCPVKKEVARKIKTKKAIIDKNGTLKFTYTLDDEVNTGDKSLKFYSINEILDSIYEALLKTPQILIRKDKHKKF